MSASRSLLPAACLATVALAVAGLLAPHPASPGARAARPAPPSVDDVPRIDPNMVEVNRRTREALDACHARGPQGAGVLVVVAPGRDGKLTVRLRRNAAGVCAYRVDD